MTTLTHPPIQITPEISAAFSKGRCDDASHGKPVTEICNHANKCIVAKRGSYRWAIVHDEEDGFDDVRIPLVSWHLRFEAPVSMMRLVAEDSAVAEREMGKLKAVATLIRERSSDKGSEAELSTRSASQDSEMSVPSPDSALSSKQAMNIQLAAERALKAMAPRKKEKKPETEPTGMDDDEDWDILGVEPIGKNWVWIKSEEERRKAKARS